MSHGQTSWYWRDLETQSCHLCSGSGRACEAQTTCGKDQLCVGLEAGIDGVIRRMLQLEEENTTDDDWGFLTVDDMNEFNEVSHIATLWAARHN